MTSTTTNTSMNDAVIEYNNLGICCFTFDKMVANQRADGKIEKKALGLPDKWQTITR